MKELEYPFDSGWILSNRKKIRKRLFTAGENFIEKKVAVLGGSTTANIVQILDLFLLNQGIKASFYESEYGMYFEDAVFANEKLTEFHPDVIYICTTSRNVTIFPALSDDAETINHLLDQQFQKYTIIWDKLSEKYACPIIQNNFEMPMYRLLGNQDVADIHGAGNFLLKLNTKIYEYAQEHEDFFVCDINYISADYGLKEWADPFYWYMYKYALNVNAIPYLSFNIANIIKSIFGKNKKGFVLDLDNTLWGGIIGDEGVDNISIGAETSAGQVYSEFQRYIKEQAELGILLNIDSKNEEENAIAGLTHSNSILSPDDFIEIKANWNSKDRNFAEIADTLNLLPESLVFIDDNPAERYIISEQFPGVCAPEIGESHQYIQNIDRSGFFEPTYLSKDDLKRNAMYQENAKRIKSQVVFSNYDEYLESLEMKAIIRPFESVYMARIAQLTNKSNQFNLTTKRYTQREIEEIAKNNNYITLYGKLEDRFGDNGVVSVCIGRIEDDICHIELWLMSCRVLKRNMEYAMMDTFIHKCLRLGITEIRGYYYPTQKNGIVKEFYPKMGFDMFSERSEETTWYLSINNSYLNKNKYIQVEVENDTKRRI